MWVQAEIASCRPQCPLKNITQIEDWSIPMQVKFAVNEGYNHDSIVTSLITTKPSCNVNRNAKKMKLNRNYINYHVMQQQ